MKQGLVKIAAGLAGLLYGIDIGVITAALPYAWGGYAGAFFMFALFALVFLFAVRLMPETKGRTLEEIEAYFAQPKGDGPCGALGRRPLDAR